MQKFTSKRKILLSIGVGIVQVPIVYVIQFLASNTHHQDLNVLTTLQIGLLTLCTFLLLYRFRLNTKPHLLVIMSMLSFASFSIVTSALFAFTAITMTESLATGIATFLLRLLNATALDVAIGIITGSLFALLRKQSILILGTLGIIVLFQNIYLLLEFNTWMSTYFSDSGGTVLDFFAFLLLKFIH